MTQVNPVLASLTAPPAETGHVAELRLIQRALSGEQAAFNSLIGRYHCRVQNVAMRYTHNRSDAEDVSQEVFMKAFRGLSHFRGESAFYTWLHRIAVNCAKTHMRVRIRNEALFTSQDLTSDENGELPIALRDDETPEQLAFGDDVRDAVNAALNALPEGLREALMYRELDGLSYEQIADAMETPIGTVRSRVHRARDVIDRQLRPVFADGLGRDTAQANHVV